MKDKLQTLTIFILLLSSVYLLFLNFGMKPKDLLQSTKLEAEEETIRPAQDLMEDAIKPESLAINFGSGHHTLIDNPLKDGYWDDIKEIIKQIFQEKGKSTMALDSISEDLYSQLLDQRSIYMEFNEGLTTLTILNALKAENNSQLVEKFPKIQSLYISLEKPFVVIKNEDNIKLLTFDDLKTENLNIKVANLFLDGYNPYDLSGEILENKNTNYIGRISDHKIEKITYQNLLETLDNQQIENIIKKFFKKDLNLIREIKEEGIQTIYVDGDKILKITNQGRISYYDPQIPKIKERNLYISLETALSFISDTLGIDDSLYLKEIKEVEQKGRPGFKIIFGKSAGNYKVEIADENIKDYLEVDVYNNHINRISKYFRGHAEERKTYIKVGEDQNLEAVIRRNIKQINQNLKRGPLNQDQILKQIQEANIIYKDKGDQTPLDLYWQIKIQDQIIELKIEN